MSHLFSFIFLGALIIWVYSLTVDWTVNLNNIKRRSKKLFGYSVLTGFVALILDLLFARF